MLGKSNEDVQKLIPQWHADLKNKRHHKYMKVNAVYAQKPMGDSGASAAKKSEPSSV